MKRNIMFIEEHPLYNKQNRTLKEEIEFLKIKICEDCGLIIKKGWSCGACNDVEIKLRELER